MATSKEIEAGAKAIAEDLRIPGGGLKKLARVVEDLLGRLFAIRSPAAGFVRPFAKWLRCARQTGWKAISA